MEEKGYPASGAGLKKGGQKDASAYSEKAGQGVAGGERKGAKLDKQGGASSGRNEKDYKEHCNDE